MAQTSSSPSRAAEPLAQALDLGLRPGPADERHWSPATMATPSPGEDQEVVGMGDEAAAKPSGLGHVAEQPPPTAPRRRRSSASALRSLGGELSANTRVKQVAALRAWSGTRRGAFLWQRSAPTAGRRRGSTPTHRGHRAHVAHVLDVTGETLRRIDWPEVEGSAGRGRYRRTIATGT